MQHTNHTISSQAWGNYTFCNPQSTADKLVCFSQRRNTHVTVSNAKQKTQKTNHKKKEFNKIIQGQMSHAVKQTELRENTFNPIRLHVTLKKANPMLQSHKGQYFTLLCMCINTGGCKNQGWSVTD